MNYSQKQIDYHKKWRSVRENKIKFYLKNAVLYWSVPMTLMYVLFNQWDVRLSFKQEMIFEYTGYFILMSLFGILKAYFQFKGQEKVYRKMKNEGLLV